MIKCMNKEMAEKHYIALLKECFNEAKEGDFIPVLFINKCMQELKDVIDGHKSIIDYRDKKLY